MEKIRFKKSKIYPKIKKIIFLQITKNWTIVQIFGRTANGVMWFCGGWGIDLHGVRRGIDSRGHVYRTC
jgi:hypothetical protein